MSRIALITTAQFPAPALLTLPGLAAEVHDVDIYDLSGTDLATFDALLIGTGADQRVLAEQRGRLQAFLDAGRTIVYCGHVAYPFLDALNEFVPLARCQVQDLLVWPLRAHPLFEGLTSQELTFRRGVAGFYGRGHNPPPADALVLNGLGAQRSPVDWLRMYPGGGALLIHAGNDLWGYGEQDGEVARLPGRLVQWIADRSAERPPGGRSSTSLRAQP